MRTYNLKEAALPTLSLFLSAGTLVCCALPALFITLGMGATLAGLVTAMPQLVWLSQYKIPLFLLAGIILLAGGYLQWRSRYLPCPADPAQARTCTRLRKISLGIYAVSLLLFLTGAFFAFIAPYILI